MHRGLVGILAGIAALLAAGPLGAQSPGPPQGTILQRAQEAIPDKVKFGQQIGVSNRVTRDGRLFVTTWSPLPSPKGWIVVLPDADALLHWLELP